MGGNPRHGPPCRQPRPSILVAALGRAERQRNLRGAFMVDPRRRGDLQGRRVALVDDVMTTGATLDAAARALRRAGARRITAVVAARTE